ncbi:hypothetical protein F2P81_019602 [Scophthalmus maximus]|uniref:Uncharacterized protein n=1 Tax=Scophthalmus maximus TaxID=52904 RepID=A0A6A4S890_SCOMX|nr:hypothetical protein F2P81_019602 [Scophthalmus maximus]
MQDSLGNIIIFSRFAIDRRGWGPALTHAAVEQNRVASGIILYSAHEIFKHSNAATTTSWPFDRNAAAAAATERRSAAVLFFMGRTVWEAQGRMSPVPFSRTTCAVITVAVLRIRRAKVLHVKVVLVPWPCARMPGRTRARLGNVNRSLHNLHVVRWQQVLQTQALSKCLMPQKMQNIIEAPKLCEATIQPRRYQY